MDDSPAARSMSPTTDAEATLEELTRHAQHELQSQPLPTQINVTKQTRQIFSHYTKHGTASSLRSAIISYFEPDSRDKDDLVVSPPLPAEYIPPSPNPEDSRMVDEDSRELVRDMPFRVDRKFHIRPNVKLPKDLFEGIDRIFRLYQAQAEAMLSHHCEKYGNEAIFRVGIRSLILSRSETLFESKTSHPQGLDAETRLFFLQVYERHPDLNIAEQRLLARSARISPDVVKSFWETMTSLRVPYMAMRTVIAARELRKQRAYRVQQEQLREQRRLQAASREHRRQRDERRRAVIVTRTPQQQQGGFSWGGIQGHRG